MKHIIREEIMKVEFDGKNRYVLKSQIENTMYYSKASYERNILSSKRYFKLYDIVTCEENIKWLHGEQIFFDTKAECDEYSKNYFAELEAKKYKNKLLAKFKDLSVEQLEELISEIEKRGWQK